MGEWERHLGYDRDHEPSRDRSETRELARHRATGVDKDGYVADPTTGKIMKVSKAESQRSQRLETSTRRFFKYLARGELFGDALIKADIRWPRVKEAMEANTSLVAEYDRAVIENAEVRQKFREDEADRRAMKGTESLQYDGSGRLVKKTITPSDTMLKAQLEANNPEKYRGRIGVNITNVNVDPKMASTLQGILEENRRRTGLLEEKRVAIDVPSKIEGVEDE